jgi:hypothetical protein
VSGIDTIQAQKLLAKQTVAEIVVIGVSSRTRFGETAGMNLIILPETEPK